MYALVDKIHAGQYRGATGEVIQDVVNIGVGVLILVHSW
jgi:glucose-6-phosphate isomerase